MTNVSGGGHRVPPLARAILNHTVKEWLDRRGNAVRAVPAVGPFGDHLGYYSLQHPFPVMKVENVWHRPDAIWPFTVVGRPPQEDTSFGTFIHELTGDLIPDVLPGIKAVHAVDAAGVHPLLLAIVAHGFSRRTDARGDRGIRDDATLPDRLDQRRMVDEPPR